MASVSCSLCARGHLRIRKIAKTKYCFMQF
ncbi:hypothetical protein COLO4_31000 [Corchorus olitorius]|uniref:Uncharacterized protein n=1 Tax=Corchorus olitorius TaxID=93759 RepID=A0A1R3H6C0_9ROSI|nr:hypothetical protein COLO4_31000 [Corchorus olitorius]